MVRAFFLGALPFSGDDARDAACTPGSSASWARRRFVAFVGLTAASTGVVDVVVVVMVVVVVLTVGDS
jgi:hypothetical protein